MICPHCAADNRPENRFCRNCGRSLAAACATCGTPLEPDDRFCGKCGTPTDGVTPDTTPVTPHPTLEPPSAERRLVSILFADLVGFTSFSESRDPEEVRELLTRYFDMSRRLIERYGGLVEKFIGDAVMAVWGTPVAREDDAERAVRAALDLADAVSAMGQEIGALDLQARVGVLTGEAAVTLGAEGQGMVAGDLVNTASRIQAAAPAGTVYVGEATRRATEAAVVYEDAGAHDLKGKAERLGLWRAVRVVAKVGGGLRSVGLEAPFVGRDRELRMLKELFHASADQGKTHLVSVVGIGGMGKSRLSWEFYKYIDGVAGSVRWHRGRCLSYGEGVTYWALAEMVRTRAGIAEGEEPVTALPKLRQALDESVPDTEERRWLEPRLAHLLGLEERIPRERDDLFAAWRRFYERLAEEMPTVMVFEDMQWADAALLEFVEYLLEWSRNYPLFLVCLARPELTERRPTWGTGKGATTIYLEPLPEDAVRGLLSGIVPGLPDGLRDEILQRAQGVPLYAVETVRMLLDRGLLVREGGEYRPTGPIASLEIPESLHALIAARLDGLSAQERRLVQDGSVLGTSFTRASVAALSGLDEAALEPLLSSLVRKEILSIQADPLSPERGQYGFLQDLVRFVAYETLSRRERKARHLTVAAYLQAAWGTDDEDIVEVVASHYLDAYRAAPDSPDAAEIKSKARDMLSRAGERAASLAANDEAQKYFDQAADLADESRARAELVEQAGRMAWQSARWQDASARFTDAIRLFEAEGDTHGAARVAARLGEVEWGSGRLDDALARMEQAFAVLSKDAPGEDLAALAAQLGRFYSFKSEWDLAAERTEFALETAERLWLPEVLSQALITRGVVATFQGRLETALAVTIHAREVALNEDLPTAALRAHINVGEILCRRERHEEAIENYRKGLVLARRIGDRFQERFLMVNLGYPLYMTGHWNEVIQIADEIPPEQRSGLVSSIIPVLIERGELEEAERFVAAAPRLADSTETQEQAGGHSSRARLARARGDHAAALAEGRAAFELRAGIGVAGEDVKGGFEEAVMAALTLGELDQAEELLAIVRALQPGEQPPFLRALSERFGASLAAARGEERVEPGFKAAGGMFRELGLPFHLAATLLEHAEWLAAAGRADDAGPLVSEAREIFSRLQATPWIERGDRVTDRLGVASSSR